MRNRDRKEIYQNTYNSKKRVILKKKVFSTVNAENKGLLYMVYDMSILF